MDDRDKEKKIEPEKFCRSFLKKAVQRMKKLTKYTPEKTFTIEKNGFHGTYYKPEKDNYPGKVLIVFGGSVGSYMLTEMCTGKYYEAGINVMAVAYRDVPGAPDKLQWIPLELVGNAIEWCREYVAKKVAVLMLSAGCDVLLPSEDICKKVMKRLQEKNFVYPYRHLHYRTASHYLCPAKPLTAKLFRVERKQPQACDESREKAFEDTMKFLKEEWK